MSTLVTTNIKNPSSSTNNIILNTDGTLSVENGVIKFNTWQTTTGETLNPVIQVEHLTYTDRVTISSSNTTRIPISNFFVDIIPKYATSMILVTAHLSVGHSSTPEWSWFIDRTVGGVTVPVGTATQDGNRMYGYHGGPEDQGADFYRETRSFSHQVADFPNTTNSCRYQICFQDLWNFGNPVYVNRSHEYSNNGYINSGSSSITVMEIMQ